jgi:hypothetical protein
MGSALCCNRRREGVSSKPFAIVSEQRSINDLPDEICKRGREKVSSEPSAITSEHRSINDLPDEILLKILSYVEPEDLSYTAGVCKRWYILSRDVTLWKNVCFKCYHSFRIERVVKVRCAVMLGFRSN